MSNLVNEFNCYVCRRTLPARTDGALGFTQHPAFEGMMCYDCLAREEAKAMVEGSRIILYLVKQDDGVYRVANWPGTLVFSIDSFKMGKHNICGHQFFIRFFGPDGAVWSGLNLGDNQILRCRKLKRQRKNLKPLNESAYIKPYDYNH